MMITSMSQFSIRRLTVDDVRLYKPIRLEAVKCEPTAFGGSYEDEVLQPDSFYVDKLANIWSTPESAVFGAFDTGGNILGTVGIFKRSGRKLSHKAILWGMYVKASHRKYGIGRQLLARAVEFAKRIPVDRIELTVVTENQAAAKLYQAIGFETWGEEPAALKIAGRLYGEYHMSFSIG
jgi:RimJ/RimL family protein N-acetyltransferase